MMQEKNFEIPLHDIKPIIEVQEYSFYYFIALIVLAVLAFSLLVYMLYAWYRKRNRYNIRKEHLELYNTLDLDDTKNSAYSLSLYAFSFKDDSPGHQEAYEALNVKLQEFKYKKEIDSFDEETLELIKNYKEMLRA